MNLMIYMAMIASLLLLLFPLRGLAAQAAVDVPPVAQPLVREGDFAVKLVVVLGIGSAEDEIEAESLLAASGILPENGWIADYPVTPEIIGVLQQRIGEAA